jgi:hypothetical protein
VPGNAITSGAEAPDYLSCPAGDMFYISDRAHTLHFGSGFWGLVLPFLVVAAEAVGMWESPVLGFPYFHRLIIWL